MNCMICNTNNNNDPYIKMIGAHKECLLKDEFCLECDGKGCSECYNTGISLPHINEIRRNSYNKHKQALLLGWHALEEEAKEFCKKQPRVGHKGCKVFLVKFNPSIHTIDLLCPDLSNQDRIELGYK